LNASIVFASLPTWMVRIKRNESSVHHCVQQNSGKPEVETVPDPIVKCGEAKIKILAASANPSDVKNIQDAIRQITSGMGVDVAFDCVGGELSEPVLSRVGRLWRLTVIMSVGARRVSFDPLNFYHRRLTLFARQYFLLRLST